MTAEAFDTLEVEVEGRPIALIVGGGATDVDDASDEISHQRRSSSRYGNLLL